MSIAVESQHLELQEKQSTTRLPAKSGKIAYLVNQYPLPSSTFIRREIEALEQLGVEVQRYSIRQSKKKLKDAKDLMEASRTRVLLELGPSGLIFATCRMLIKHPWRMLKACRLTRKIVWHSDRGLLINFIYLAEACVLIEMLQAEEIDHVHAHYGTNSTSVAMLCRELGGPAYSFTSHGPDEFDKPQFLRLGEKVARSKFAVAISEYGRSQIYRWTEYKHWKKIHVVHCGLDQEFLHAETTPPSSASRLLFIGRLSEQKGDSLVDRGGSLVETTAHAVRTGVGGRWRDARQSGGDDPAVRSGRRGHIGRVERRCGGASSAAGEPGVGDGEFRRRVAGGDYGSIGDGAPGDLDQRGGCCRVGSTWHRRMAGCRWQRRCTGHQDA